MKHAFVAVLAVSMALVVLGVVTFGLLTLSLKRGPVDLPQAQTFVERAINARLDRQELSIGAVALRSGGGGMANRLQLRDVTLRDANGTPILFLKDVRSAFSLRDMIAGRLVPSVISIVDTKLLLRRDAQGRIDILSGSLGDDNQPPLMETIEALAQRPELAALRRVDLSGARVSLEDLATGKTWTFDNPALTLTRNDSGSFTLHSTIALTADQTGYEDAADSAILRLTAEATPGDAQAELAVQIEQADPASVAELFRAFDWLRQIESRVSGSVRTTLARDGSLGALSGVLDLGQGRLTGTPDSRPVRFDQAKVYFSFDPQADRLTLDGVEARTSSGMVKASGYATLHRRGDGGVRALAGQLRLSEVEIDRPDLFDEKIRLDGASVDARLSFDPLRLEVGRMSVHDGETTLRISGVSEAGKSFWRNRYEVDIDRLDQARLKELWPRAVEPKTRRWLVENVRAGLATDFRGGLRTQDGALSYAFNFNVSEARVRFLKTVPDVENARGFGYLTDRDFRLDITEGTVTAQDGSPVRVAGSSLYIPDIRQKPTPGEIRLNAQTSLSGALHLLDSEKFRFLEKEGLSPRLASGRTVVSGTFKLPLHKETKFDQVELDLTATLTDVASDSIVAGRQLSARSLLVNVTSEGLTLSGDMMLDGVPLKAQWMQPFGKGAKAGSRILARLSLSDENLRRLGIGLPSGTVTGAAGGKIDIGLRKGRPPTFTLSSDLRGARLAVPAIGWAKAADAAGALRLSGTLGARPEVSSLSLTGGGLSASGRLQLAENGKLIRADLSELTIGDWLDARAALIPREGGATDIELTEGSLDLRSFRPAPDGGGGAGGGATRISANLDRLRITNELALTNVRAELASSGGLRGRFTGNVNNGTPINGRMFPQPQGTAIELTSDNAGGVLKSANLLQNAKWGEMKVLLLPREGRGNYDGTLRIDRVRLRDASAMADLLNAISLVGLLQQLQGSGIHFSTVEGQFALRDGAVQLRNVSAVGPSMGITLDGWYSSDTKSVDFEGVTTPLYAVNGVFERIFGPLMGRRKGEGMFSFTYRMRGQAENPRVSVNPLSILTPGAFREIFRQNAPKPPPGTVVAREDPVARPSSKQGEGTPSQGPEPIAPERQAVPEEAAPKPYADQAREMRDVLR